jgi:hypothetical protein
MSLVGKKEQKYQMLIKEKLCEILYTFCTGG